jgi:MoaA/NifB/PqqE/SkfB family radical SAM enzyme
MSWQLGAAVVDHAAALGASAVSFTGGEPLLLLDDVTRLVRRAAAAGIRHTRTGTNGFLFTGAAKPGFHSRVARLAARLAGSGLRNFWISLDSADPGTHERMRGLPGVTAGIEQALPHFHAAGLYPSVNLGLTRGMGNAPLPDLAAAGEEGFRAAVKESLDAFFRRAVDLGFSMANICYPMSAGGGQRVERSAYRTTSESTLVTFTDEERVLLYSALAEAVEEHRGRLRIFTPLSSLAALTREHGHGAPGYPCRGGLDYFFVDASGDTFPCGYRGDENLGPFVRLDPARLPEGQPCRSCDWECFRDPSELLGPVTGLSRMAVLPLRGLRRRDERTSQWQGDVRYALACGLFDGRRPADRRRLARFAPARRVPQHGRTTSPDLDSEAPQVTRRGR